MKVNNLVKGIMAVSLLIFTASCEEENESLQGGNSGNNTQTTDTHEAVDLGLSVKWATCNVGASRPEDYGGYYAWGETEEKDTYTWENYKYWTDKNENGIVDNFSEITSIPGNICSTKYDVAHVKWGGDWRMPTPDEFKELIEKCTWEIGAEGFSIIGPNGNKIFLPYSGEKRGNLLSGIQQEGAYRTGTLDFDYDFEYADGYTKILWIREYYFYDEPMYHMDNNYDIYIGLSVRPVMDF